MSSKQEKYSLPPSNELISLETISSSCYSGVHYCSRRTQALDGDYYGFLKYVGCPAPTEDRKEGCLSFLNESFPLLRSEKLNIDHGNMEVEGAINKCCEWRSCFLIVQWLGGKLRMLWLNIPILSRSIFFVLCKPHSNRRIDLLLSR